MAIRVPANPDSSAVAFSHTRYSQAESDSIVFSRRAGNAGSSGMYPAPARSTPSSTAGNSSERGRFTATSWSCSTPAATSRRASPRLARSSSA